DLPDEVAERGGEGHEIQVHREQDQLDRHQDDDDVLPVQEDAEHADREQHGRNGEVMRDSDFHGPGQIPLPVSTFLTSIAVAGVRATWAAMLWRLTPALWRSVSTMAPIMATS